MLLGVGGLCLQHVVSRDFLPPSCSQYKTPPWSVKHQIHQQGLSLAKNALNLVLQ